MATAGSRVKSADIASLESYVNSRPIGRIYQGAAQSIAHNSDVALTWDSEVYDTASQHDISTNPSRVTPNVAGYYRFRVCAYLAANTDYTQIRLRFRFNGGDVAPETRWASTGTTSQISSFQCEVMLDFNGSTDYIEAFIRHTNGAAAARNTSVANPVITLLEWEFIRPL